jgi:hypothetical protein
MGDPRGSPVAVGRIGLGIGLAWAGSGELSLKGDGGEGEGEKGQNWAHGIRPSGFQSTSLTEKNGVWNGIQRSGAWEWVGISRLHALDLAAL